MKSILIEGKEHFVEDEKKEELGGLLTDRPRTAAGSSLILEQKPEINASFSISSRQQQQLSPQSTMHTRNALQCKESDVNSSTSTLVGGSQALNNNQDDEVDNHNEKKIVRIRINDSKRMFFMPSELNASQIIDNPKVISFLFLIFQMTFRLISFKLN